jgi:hypothetical protein
LADPRLNRGTAFTDWEQRALDLIGLSPPRILATSNCRPADPEARGSFASRLCPPSAFDHSGNASLVAPDSRVSEPRHCGRLVDAGVVTS